MTALITISFVMRNTSPIGWIPLLLHKIIFDGSFIPFLKSGFIVAIPTIFAAILIDSWFYGFENGLTFTSYNFLKVNLIHGFSKYFGENHPLWYLFATLPYTTTALAPFTLFAMCYYHLKL